MTVNRRHRRPTSLRGQIHKSKLHSDRSREGGTRDTEPQYIDDEHVYDVVPFSSSSDGGSSNDDLVNDDDDDEEDGNHVDSGRVSEVGYLRRFVCVIIDPPHSHTHTHLHTKLGKGGILWCHRLPYSTGRLVELWRTIG